MAEQPLEQSAPDGLTTSQAAALCGVDRRTVLRYVKDGRLPSYRTPGGHFRVRPADLASLMEQLGLDTPTSLSLRPPVVVIVDDDVHHARALERRVRKLRPDVQVLLAHDGFTGGLLVADRVPDLLLLDLVMPGLDGFAVCEGIRASRRLAGVAIVVQSGSVNAQARARLKELGADAALEKPVRPEQIAEVLGRFLPIPRRLA